MSTQPTLQSLQLRLAVAKAKALNSIAAGFIHKMNPCHVDSGSKGGQFCSGQSYGKVGGHFQPGSAMAVLYESLAANEGMWVQKSSLMALIGPGTKANVSNPEGRLAAMKSIGKKSGQWQILVSGKSVKMVKSGTPPTLTVAPKPTAPTQSPAQQRTAAPVAAPTATHAPPRTPPPAPAPAKFFPDATPAGTGQRLQSEYGPTWAAKLTLEEKISMKSYTGSGYTAVNSALRETTVLNPMVVKKIQNMDSAIKKSVVPHDIVVMRGTSKNAVAGLKEGDIYVDRGFVSTTLNASSGFGSGAKIAIHVKAGANAAFVKSISIHSSENEVLLPRNSFFKVLKHETAPDPYDSGTRVHLVLELL